MDNYPTFKDTILLWATMAVGLFKNKTPPPILGGIVPENQPELLGSKVDKLVDDVQELRRELKRKRII